ncbi:MAG: amidohydrolase family protein [Anaerolineaceae bacterium]|nr:amidohydrolase family protein [Anaerolineaceae bacterium]
MIIDFHVHIDESEEPKAYLVQTKKGREAILASMEESCIDLSVLLVIAQKNDLDATRMQNDWLAGVCKQTPRFEGFGSVHPEDGNDALAEMKRCVEELGLKGLKLHPDVQAFDCAHPGLVEIYKQAADLDIPVIIDALTINDSQQPAKLLNAYMASPQTKVCLAHVGGWRFMDFGIFGMIAKYTAFDLNVYFDLSTSINWFYGTQFQGQFCEVTSFIGADKLLFGSDLPAFSQKDALNATMDFGYPEDWLPKILGGNAARFLKIDGRDQ